MKERPILFSAPMVRAILEGRKTQTRRVVKGLRVTARHPVGADFAELLKDDRKARPGILYPAEMNQHGAVTAATEVGRLGLKPGEFDFVCPYADGNTYLDTTGGRKQWRLWVQSSRLWVRETWGAVSRNECPAPLRECKLEYRADLAPGDTDRPGGWPADSEDPERSKWRPSIHMPRWASRITLEVTGVRVERLQDISEEDAKAEGADQEFRTVVPMGGKPVGAKEPYSLPTSHRAGFANLWDRINNSWDANPWVWAISFKRIEAKSEAA